MDYSTVGIIQGYDGMCFMHMKAAAKSQMLPASYSRTLAGARKRAVQGGNTIQYNTAVEYNTVYTVVQCTAVQYSPVHYSTVQ